MPDLLLELRSEEIPARMQRKAAGDLKKMVTDGLVEAGLTYEAAREYWTPRRLTLDVRGLTARSKDVHEDIKGPSTKAPPQAIEGFLRKAGLSDVSQAHVHSDAKKGDFYVAHVSKPGRAAEDIIAELVPAVIRAFPWPKSMRWGPASAKPGSLRWVRPLQSIVCTFGPETEEPVVVDFDVDGVRSGNVTYGHRFHAPGAIVVRRFQDYAAKLEAAKVVIDADRRKEIIIADARNLAFASGLELVEDEGLLEEVSGLVEWPVVLMGEFEQDFLAIPPEVIRLTIRANQKCFVCAPTSPLRGGRAEGAGGGSSSSPPPLTPPIQGEGNTASLSNHFLLTANIEAKDGGREIAHGNGKVVRARLSDALYFWKTDQGDLPDLGALDASAEKFGLKRDAAGKLLPLDQRMARLDHLNVTFHAKLGTQGERVERIARLARELAPIVERSLTSPLRGGRAEGAGGGNDAGRGVGLPPPLTPPLKGEGDLAALAARAAVLAKADLTTEIVGEFPELQGAMGRKYAALQGEHPSVAAAIEEHYKPQGPSDRVPTDPVSVAVALADKLDTLVGFWAIDEKPTGSKDPYALRRAALGVVRILIENKVQIHLSDTLWLSLRHQIVPSEDGFNEFSNAIVKSDHMGGFAQFVSSNSTAHKRHFELLQGVFEKITIPEDFPLNRGSSDFPVWYGVFQEYAIPLIPAIQTEWADMHGLDTARVRRLAQDAVEPVMRLILADLLSFFHDRLKVYLREQGARHDLIDAVLAGGRNPSSGPSGHLLPQGEKEGRSVAAGVPSPLVGEGGSARSAETGEGYSGNDDLLQIVRRVEALGSFLATDEGKNLLAGTKRAANILAAEEKKKTAVAASVDPALFNNPAEEKLFAAVNQAESKAGEAIQNEDFSAALAALSVLREPVDSFFEQVMVNDDDAAVRANRLALLSRIRAATDQVADFSKISG